MPKTQLLILKQRRRARLRRVVRATWHDTWALLHEFRPSLLTFVMATVGGGYVYGKLLIYAGYPPMAFVDLPYAMLALMMLEAPTSVPPEPYLMVFWYGMPVVGAYIVGRGAVDFVRLFLNRTERRRSWEAAVALTYRNHVIVLGVGHVGLGVTRGLVQMGFEVVAVDMALPGEREPELARLDVPVIHGDGRLAGVLESAGLPHAQALVVCTSDDHTNLVAALRARDLSPGVRIVVRMWDDRYARQLNRFLSVDSVLSAAQLAAPAFAGAAVGIEITQTLKVNGIDYSMIRLAVEPGSFLDGGTIDALQESDDVDIVLHGRDKEFKVHPPGDLVVQGGDTLVIFARHEMITQIVSRNRRHGARRPA